mmetsp:Transcript_16741/g.15098  ORF Transcript_16741/g.15098 Transcript_16741/m.15098 type:complete len:226 (-) Transcript_16741:24-701(-)
MTNSITVFGYGSLMSFKSTLSTMPSARNFRAGYLPNYIRIFNIVSVLAICKGVSNEETKEMSVLAIRPTNNPNDKVYGCLFDIPSEELPAYLLREQRYKFKYITVTDLSTKENINCITVIENTDDEYRSTLSSAMEYDQKVGKYYQGQLWGRKDVLPVREYLIRCLLAAFELGDNQYVNNLLDQTLLADEKTLLRDYVLDNIVRFDEVLHLISNKEYKHAKLLSN